MKTLILITLLILSFEIYAQREVDTIPVIMLVCDTARQYEIYTYLSGEPDTVYYKPNHNVYWEYGYEVMEKKFTTRNIKGNRYDYEFISGIRKWQHLKYLNANKQELNKVVWISKKTKSE